MRGLPARSVLTPATLTPGRAGALLFPGLVMHGDWAPLVGIGPRADKQWVGVEIADVTGITIDVAIGDRRLAPAVEVHDIVGNLVAAEASGVLPENIIGQVRHGVVIVFDGPAVLPGILAVKVQLVMVGEER